MDELSRSKFRAVGAITVLVIAVLAIFFVFYQAKEKKNTVLKLRGVYTDLIQTLQFSMNLNMEPEYWGFKAGYRNVAVLDDYVFKYLRIKENCVKTNGTCFPEESYLNFAKEDSGIKLGKLPSVILNNNISIAVETISQCKKKDSPCALIYVDINSTKKPNVLGKDLFVLVLSNSKKNPILPYAVNLPKDELLHHDKYGCNNYSKMPMYCAAYLFNNQWNLDSNYPW